MKFPAAIQEAPDFIALMSYSAPSIAKLIDHTLLRPEATRADILQLCREALDYNFASVCVNAYWVPLAASQLAGSQVKVCTVVGFPLGATSTEAKVGDRAVEEEIALVAAASHRHAAIVKVILETALLNDDQKIVACRLAQMAGADFVKTSTGFASSGATVHDVELMRRTVGPDMGVKASGGIRTLDDLLKMLDAGATRIGASASVKIVEAARAASQTGAAGS
jgi:deoxyribose-phosphate aldolase